MSELLCKYCNCQLVNNNKIHQLRCGRDSPLGLCACCGNQKLPVVSTKCCNRKLCGNCFIVDGQLDSYYENNKNYQAAKEIGDIKCYNILEQCPGL